MTKKRALKLIMACGIQRNEAQRLLLIEHEKGHTNLDAYLNIRIANFNADCFYKKIVQAAQVFGVSIRKMADALKEIGRREFHENPCD